MENSSLKRLRDINALERLTQLKEKGILTQEEFEQQKQSLLNTPDIDEMIDEIVENSVLETSNNTNSALYYNFFIIILSSIPLVLFMTPTHAAIAIAFLSLFVIIADICRKVAYKTSYTGGGLGVWDTIQSLIYWKIGPQCEAVALFYIIAISIIFFAPDFSSNTAQKEVTKPNIQQTSNISESAQKSIMFSGKDYNKELNNSNQGTDHAKAK